MQLRSIWNLIMQGTKIKMLQCYHIIMSSHNSDVPHVKHTDLQLIDISGDVFVSLVDDNGNTKDDIRLPFDDQLFT